MNIAHTQNSSGMSDAERDLLRKSVRDLMANAWPAETAVTNASDPAAVAKLWAAMARQGLTAVGSETAGAGLNEIVLVFEELGRAACPAPLVGALAANLALTQQPSNAARALLEDIHQGEASAAVALGAHDGDAAAGDLRVDGDMLTGKVCFVESAGAATHILVFTARPAGVAIVASGGAGLTIEHTPGLAVPPLSELTFDKTPAVHIPLPADALADIAMVARLVCAGRALGAAQRGFDLAVEHVKVRKQFGQPVGQFQAIQHKLANNLISLDGARLTLEAAAQARDDGNPHWRVFAAAAIAFVSPALRAVAVETQRALGAIGYAEEHEAPRHFRRVHADLVRFGGVSRARAELADFLLGPVQ
jgi:alkylation response protein AidB-like acyl-CoA dehydrogenase